MTPVPGDASKKPTIPTIAPLPAQAASLANQAAAAIRKAVRDGSLQPGELYSAYQIADDLGVSRSPVRDALMRLAEAGMVVFERNRGFRIVIPGPKDIADVFQMRILLEVPAARWAATHGTPDLLARLDEEFCQMLAGAARRNAGLFMQHDQLFHALVMGATGNDRMVKQVDHLRDTTNLLGASTVGRSRGLEDIASEHLPILRAIQGRDAVAAGEAMASHIAHTGRLLVEQAAAEAGLMGNSGELEELLSRLTAR